MKTTIALLGILTITLALVAQVQAQYSYSDNGDGTCTITGYSGPGGAVTIPATINGLTVTFIGNSAFANYASLTSVTIPGNVISILGDAFAGCYGLTSVTIGSGVIYIGTAAFDADYNMTSVILGSSVATIENSAFEECSSLTSIYCLGNAPSSVGSLAFFYDNPTVYYLSGTTGWSAFSATTHLQVEVWNTPPTIAINLPTSGSSYSTTSSTITLAGTASDTMGIVNVTWSSPQNGGSGTASGTTSWTANNISLASGTNIIAVTAYDAAGDQSTATLTVTFITSASQVTIAGLYNTGVNNDGTLATLGTSDSHYALVSVPSGSTGTPWVVSPYPGAWWSGTANANWLSPSLGYSSDSGQYDYRLVFSMVDSLGHPLDPADATITGVWTADDGVSLLLNGIPVATNNTSFASLGSFAVSSGFLAVTNTLDFLVSNALTVPNPTGLLVSDLYGTAGSSPAITSGPVSQIVEGLANVAFQVTAVGGAPLSYQWSLNNSNIVGATSSSLTISNVAQTNLGTYAVVVTNGAGTATSSNATLSMYPFLAHPFGGLDTYWGYTNTLSVGAWGTGPLDYQWFDDGNAIDGATNQTLTLTGVQFINAGLYSVVVTSPLGSVTNASEQVVVNPAGVSFGGLYPSVIIQGVVGYNYVIQSTANLSDTNSWVTVTNLTLTQPIQLWIDSNTDASLPANPNRFYKVLPGQ